MLAGLLLGLTNMRTRRRTDNDAGAGRAVDDTRKLTLTEFYGGTIQFDILIW